MKEFICLMYHGIGDELDKFSVTKESFILQLEWIVSKGYRICDIKSVAGFRDLKFCVFTFDDGRLSDHWVAERLAEIGATADFFLVRNFIHKDSTRFLNESLVRKVSDLGHSIGVHGKSHSWWTSIDPKKLVKELTDTKHYLEDLTGRAVVGCSAPGGKINSSVVRILEEANIFSFIRNSKPFSNPINHGFEINGLAIDKYTNLPSFDQKLSGNKLHLQRLLIAYHGKKIVKDLFNK